MGGLFGRPKTVTAPSLPKVEVPTVPEIISETEGAGEAEKRAARRRRGRRATVITGELEPVTTKKTLLG